MIYSLNCFISAESFSISSAKADTRSEDLRTTASSSVAIAEVSSVEDALSVASCVRVSILSVTSSRCELTFWIFPVMVWMEAIQESSAPFKSSNICCVLSSAATCSSDASLIFFISSIDFSEFWLNSLMILLISLTVCADWVASPPISSATTANPRPASPARQQGCRRRVALPRAGLRP